MILGWMLMGSFLTYLAFKIFFSILKKVHAHKLDDRLNEVVTSVKIFNPDVEEKYNLDGSFSIPKAEIKTENWKIRVRASWYYAIDIFEGGEFYTLTSFTNKGLMKTLYNEIGKIESVDWDEVLKLAKQDVLKHLAILGKITQVEDPSDYILLEIEDAALNFADSFNKYRNTKRKKLRQK